MTFDFDLILGSYLTFWGPNGLFLGLGVGFENCFGVYSCSWTTFIFYVSIHSDIWFRLKLLLKFCGPSCAFFGVGVGFKHCFRVYLCSWTTFISLFLSILSFDFNLILGSFFFTFWGPNGLFLGLMKGSYTVLGSTYVVKQLSFSIFPSILTFGFDLILV